MKTYNGKVENSLHYCAKGICQSCHYRSESDCKGSLIKDAAKEEANDQRLIESQLETMQEQKAEIEKLNKDAENFLKVAEYQQGLTMKKSFEIKDLKAEIERLQEEIGSLNKAYPCTVKMNDYCLVYARSLDDYDDLIGDISAEAIKEFAERLTDIFPMLDALHTAMGIVMKEMGVEDKRKCKK